MKRIIFLVVAFALCMSTMSQIRMHIWKDGKSRDYVVYDVDNMIPNVDSVTFSGVVKAEDTPVATSPATPSTTQSATPKEVNTTTNGVVAAPIQESKKVVSTSETNKKTNVKAENIESTNTQPSKTMASTVPSPVVASQAASPKKATTILYQPAEGEGVFSIGENKQVVFASGNLRYAQSTGTWDFAENQYDMVNVNNIEVGGTIDLFGWSGNQSTEKPWGVNASTNNSDYAGEFVDWGTNTIANTQPNTWRTLTADEWNYLLNSRKDANQLKGVAQINSINGLVLLPDNWTLPLGIEFKTGFHTDYGAEFYATHQTFTPEQWQFMEDAGAVFLPAAGVRNGNDTYFANTYCNYWTATPSYDYYAQYLCSNSADAYTDHHDRSNGRSVRLVKDVVPASAKAASPAKTKPVTQPSKPAPVATQPAKTTKPAPTAPKKVVVSQPVGCFSVGADQYVAFAPGNLQYTYSSRKWSFAENQYDTIGNANTNGTTLGSVIDMFGWSTSSSVWGVSTSSNNTDYAGEFLDWGANTIGKDKPNTWRTLTSEEWDYLLNLRPDAANLKGIAQVAGVNGLVLLSDNWTTPAGLTFKSGFVTAYDESAFAAHQTFTAEQWAQMQEAGAVFLPAAGVRNGASIYFLNNYCNYWSATSFGDSYAFYISATPNEAYVGNADRNNGQAVRLVKNTAAPVVATTPAVPSVPVIDEMPEMLPVAELSSEQAPVVNNNPTAFSVSATQLIEFSPGNLQYTQSTGKWSFAENQYDTIGNANVVNGELGDKIDLFGHSSNATAKWGVSLSTNDQDYNGTYIDWGTLKIGNYSANTWRTLTSEEWDYLLNIRANATMLKGIAQVVGVNGVVLLPDNWDASVVGVAFNPRFGLNDFTINTIDADQWLIMEKAGAVFLPATGMRLGTTLYFHNEYCQYWSATPFNANYAFYINASASEMYMTNNGRSTAQAVRLVKNVEGVQ